MQSIVSDAFAPRPRPRGAGARYLGLGLLAATLVAVPLASSSTFVLDVATKICIAAIVCIGLNLLIGYAGQISLGHGAFFAMGSYATAILGGKYGWPPLAAMAAGGLCVAVLAYVLGRAILHLRGHYLAMATLGAGAIVAIVLNREIAITGGPDGMAAPPFSVFGYELGTAHGVYALAAFALCAAVRCAGTLIDSRVGRALRSLKDSEVAAETMGVPIAHYKVIVFVISAVFASVAGSLFAHADRFVAPVEADFLRSVEFVAMVVVGGMGSTMGAVVGAVVLTLLPQLLAHFEDYRQFATGAILVGIMVFMPRGVAPTLISLWKAARQEKGNTHGTA